MNWSIGPGPLAYGSAGTSARPSVIELNPCNVNVTLAPVAAPRQPRARSGFPSGEFIEVLKTAVNSKHAVDGCTAVSGNLSNGVLKTNPTVDLLTAQPHASTPGTTSHFGHRSRCIPLAAVASLLGGFFPLTSFGIEVHS